VPITTRSAIQSCAWLRIADDVSFVDDHACLDPMACARRMALPTCSEALAARGMARVASGSAGTGTTWALISAP
jgi:hypothetical protein